MNKPQISIIIPIYNAEAFLHRCIDSVLSQSFTNWECILVDDGSPDNSGAICDEYAAKDSRIIVFHKKNGGVSSARNLGLDNAKGEWITFLDADDALGSNFLENFDGSCDLVVAIENRSDGSLIELLSDGIYEGDTLKNFWEQNLACHILRTPWGKFFRRALISSARFDETLHLGEDTLFCHHYFQKCKVVKVDYTRLYLYTVSECSAKYQLDVDYALHAFRLLKSAYYSLGLSCPLYERFLFSFFIQQLGSSKEALRKWYADNEVRQFYMETQGKSIRQFLSYFYHWIQTYK